MKALKIAAVAAIAVLLIAAFLILRPARREATVLAMGGIPLKVIAYGRTPWQFSGDIAAVKEHVAKLETTFDRYAAESELSRLNREAVAKPFPLSPEMMRIMAISRRWQQESGGAFDPTVGPLIALWREAGRKGTLPSEKQIAAARGLVGMERVTFVGVGRVRFAREGMNLDFGAIAKGLADDVIAELLSSRGVRRGVVDAGGNALAFGEGAFRFGIQDPTAGVRGELLATVEMPAGAIMTSGNYERFSEIGGKRYSHIVDPRTGEPVDNGLLSATVVGGTGADADAIATALIVLGREKAIELLKKLGARYAGVLVERTGEGETVWVSEALLPRLELAKPWASKVRTF
jgi:FAD:protein FMN transferase